MIDLPTDPAGGQAAIEKLLSAAKMFWEATEVYRPPHSLPMADPLFTREGCC
jgi:hypothetical protein